MAALSGELPVLQCDGGCDCCRPESWLHAARRARQLSWASLGWMTVEGVVGLIAGFSAGSISLIGWALSSVVEGLASVIVIWRFTGSRTLSESAERTAQRGVAISFWLLAPYVAVQSAIDLADRHHAAHSLIGIVLTATSVVIMPVLGRAKHRLGARLDSAATAGEGTQNLLCAALGAAVLVGLALNAAAGWWWADPVIGLAVAAVAVSEGRKSWQGDDCC
jgi:divalent metal cation (Fe/Co/Zn/Cd) transporter